MHPRYLVTSTRLVAGVPETSTFAFGRFPSQDAAEAAAQEQYGQYGATVSSVRPETRAESVAYRIGRACIRTLRLAFGAVVALLAYVFLWNSGPMIGTVPFGQMTLDIVFSALIRVGLLLGAAWLAWHAAFGEGPDAKYRR